MRQVTQPPAALPPDDLAQLQQSLALAQLAERADALIYSAGSMLPDGADKYRRMDHAVTLADGTVLRLVASVEVVE